MKSKAVLMLAAAVCLLGMRLTIADVGVTDACQDDIKDLEKKMRDNRDDYTLESRRKAETQLMAAKTNRMNPAKCRENIRDARKELREGKSDKKKND
jgi:hypothetical protein